MPDPRQTPAMSQFYRFKKRHPDCILLFRMGDFYETFDDDAVTCHKALGLTLTRRTEGLPMAGVPYHQLEVYLRRLIQQGFRVAVCDQVQDPKEAKGIVERAVTRVITPGTLVDDSLLEDSASNRLAAVCHAEPGAGGQTRVGIAIVEASTGAFVLLDAGPADLGDALAGRSIGELLFPDGTDEAPFRRAAESLGASCTPRPGWHFRSAEAMEAVTAQYKVASVAGFGLAGDDPALPAAGAVIRYLHETQATDQPAANTAASRSAQFRPRQATLAHLQPPRREDPGGWCTLDAVSLRSLEVERTIRSGQADGSLLGLFVGKAGTGGCRTAMGRRLVREWLCRPLGRRAEISARHACVSTLASDRRTAEALAAALGGVQDVARIAGRVAVGRATPRDLVALGRSLGCIEAVNATLENAPAFSTWRSRLAALRGSLDPLAQRILSQCVEEPPTHLRAGGLFQPGVDAELDEARLLQSDASSWLAAYQGRLAAAHNIPSIKVGFNSIFGYYIELSAGQAARAPVEFTRKQTLKNAERYTTPELRDFERKVTTAEARAIDREHVLFDALCSAAAAQLPAISEFGQAAAELDVLACFAEKATGRGWVRPEVVEEPVLSIVQGRHPVLDELLGDSFVPNDAALSAPGAGAAGASLALITGPNMAGKSTFIRQAALLVLLAHAGSFVPAGSAVIGVTDRIFTRVGADDALHAGQSTFLVEMTETASILNNATPRSLVILDEIGRGTSTLDGLSLAWAIAEYLAKAQRHSGTEAHRGTRTLFATHYHELTELEERLPGLVKNLHVSVREWGDQIVFLHRILPGRTDRSYGLHVAKLAGIPAAVVTRAREVLESLSVQSHGSVKAPLLEPLTAGRGPTRVKRPDAAAVPPDGQFGLFAPPHPAVAELRELKLDGLSGDAALAALQRLKESASL
ncbi:MAG: DNA mismatch repair protein MutS [Phycisphaerales bacterium]|nr:DNA mismatch repair protein MutS [Phycisphaerales bacterium]